jgi:hypothetical protein
MSSSVIKGCPVFIGGIDFGNSVHTLALNYGADEKDDTVRNSTTHTFIGGLKTFGFAMEGFWNQSVAEPVDEKLFGQVGASNNVLTYATATGAVGEPAYFITMTEYSYNLPGEVGEIIPFDVDGGAAGRLVRGVFEYNGTLGASANSIGINLGAVAAGQKLYAAIHVLSASGTTPTLNAVVQSDDNSGFTSATNRITFDQITAAGAQMSSVDGAITDTYWRVNFTIGGTGPSFRIIVVIGIL